MIRGLARAFAAVSALVLAAAIGVGYLAYQFNRPGPLTEDRIVMIPRGEGLNGITRLLAENGVVDDPRIFEWGVRLNRASSELKAGEYAFPPGVSPSGAMDILRSGRTLAYTITIPEGRSSHEVVAILNADQRLEGEIAEVPPEGSLLPETYSFVRGDTREQLLQRMTEAMSATLAEAWEGRAEGLPLNSPEEALILASIIEKETGVASERDLVASVFVNRLRQGMRLETDPTVIYALTQGQGPLGRELLRADLDVDSAYNTYRNAGLPPGPITNPGRASIEAALHPAETEYLYFVADGSGGHAFGRTLQEHNRNVANWRRIRQQPAGQGQPGPATP